MTAPLWAPGPEQEEVNIAVAVMAERTMYFIVCLAVVLRRRVVLFCS